MASSRVYALALAVAAAASVTSVTNGFVYDDVPVIQKDQRIHSLAHPAALLTLPAWPSDYRSNAYRPATTAALALDWALGGGRPWIFHATNVALNLIVVALVLAIATRLMAPVDRAPGAPLVAALWFAVAPVHVEAVAGAVGLSELLAAAAYLGALLAYVADGDLAEAAPQRRGRRALASLAALAAAALAYGAKESAITLPAALLLADLWLAHRAGRPPAERLRRHWLLWVAVVAIALGYLAARGAVLGVTFSGGAVAPGLMGESAAGRALVMAPALLVWARWLLWPIHLSADYLPDAFVPTAALGLPQLAGLAVLALAVWGAWAARRRVPVVTFGLVFIAVTASVAANVVVPTGVVLAERLAYLPSVGAALVLGALWSELPRARWVWPATALLLAALAARTMARIPVWHDPGRFLAALVRDAPDSYRTHWALGAEAFEHGAFGTGERELLAAIRINPLDATPAQELGERYLEAGVFAPAARYLAAAYRLDTLSTGAAARAAFAWLKAGVADSAVAIGETAVRRAPDDPALLVITESAALTAGRPRAALALARRLVLAAPGSSAYLRIAAFAAAANGRCAEARARLVQAVGASPADQEARSMLARAGEGPACGLATPPGGRSARPGP